jgi:hypothetical protein
LPEELERKARYLSVAPKQTSGKVAQLVRAFA